MRIYRRDGYIVQTQSGELAYRPDEACNDHYWNPETTNLTTLVAHDIKSRDCGPSGRYSIHDTAVSFSGSGTKSCGDEPSFNQLVVGCSTHDTLKLHASCPEKTVHSEYPNFTLLFICKYNWFICKSIF